MLWGPRSNSATWAWGFTEEVTSVMMHPPGRQEGQRSYPTFTRTNFGLGTVLGAFSLLPVAVAELILTHGGLE